MLGFEGEDGLVGGLFFLGEILETEVLFIDSLSIILE
jgi:hypothetical protein